MNAPTIDLRYGVDVLDGLRGLASGSVHCAVTSPPYFNLRSYNTGTWEGGDPECSHKPSDTPARRGLASSTLAGGKATTAHQQEGYKGECPKCGAVLIDKQMGNEELHDCVGWATGHECGQCFVCRLVAVFREVRRVLRDDGVCFLNLGDSYAGAGAGGYRPGAGRADGIVDERNQRNRNGAAAVPGIPAKNLMLIPARVALALQADGWWVRQDIIWAKTAPMPENVVDRFTKSHEYVFMLAKSPKYYFDAVAVAEPAQEWAGQAGTFARNGAVGQHVIPGQSAAEHRPERTDRVTGATRNRRDVLVLGPDPYPGSHFATMPRELARICIMAGSSAAGCCPACKAPYVRVTERTAMVINRTHNHPAELRTRSSGTMVEPPTSATTGWRASCNCGYYTCPTCASVIEYVHETSKQVLPKLRERISDVQAREEVLHSEVLFQDVCNTGTRVPGVQEDIQANHEQAGLLLARVFIESDGEKSSKRTGLVSEHEGVYSSLHAGAPYSVASDGVHNGASPSNGAGAWQEPRTGRSNSPSEREQIRQSIGELGVDDEIPSRRDAQADFHSNMPLLRGSVSDTRKCHQCGSEHLEWRPFDPQPAVVLDCFSGSGTTAAAAKACGRSAIGLDLNAAYLALAEDRIAGVTAPMVPAGYEDNAPAASTNGYHETQQELFA